MDMIVLILTSSLTGKLGSIGNVDTGYHIK